eukprot:4238430-Alexandrium_andersonii.AAC.1
MPSARTLGDVGGTDTRRWPGRVEPLDRWAHCRLIRLAESARDHDAPCCHLGGWHHRPDQCFALPGER